MVSKYSVSQHIAKVHKDVKCDECSADLKENSKAYDDHMAVHFEAKKKKAANSKHLNISLNERALILKKNLTVNNLTMEDYKFFTDNTIDMDNLLICIFQSEVGRCGFKADKETSMAVH